MVIPRSVCEILLCAQGDKTHRPWLGMFTRPASASHRAKNMRCAVNGCAPHSYIACLQAKGKELATLTPLIKNAITDRGSSPEPGVCECVYIAINNLPVLRVVHV